MAETEAATPGEPGDADAGMSFEASTERLTSIVKQLEGGELSLEKSLELFEEGVKVARVAQARLDAAEKRVDELLGTSESGEIRTRPFE